MIVLEADCRVAQRPRRSIGKGRSPIAASVYIVRENLPAAQEGGGGHSLPSTCKSSTMYSKSTRCVLAQGAICDYRSRLSAECGELNLALEAGGGDAVTQGSGSSSAAPGVSATLRVWRLEAVEHLPVGAAEAAASEAALEQVLILHVPPQHRGL